MEPLSDVEVYVKVVELGSFTRAAEALGISTSYASRRVKALEDRLGVRLLERTTRRVRLTDAGRTYHDRVSPLLDGLEEAAREAASLRAEPRGLLRIAAPLAFGVRYLPEPVALFMRSWPELEVEVSYDDRNVDLVAEGFDLAIRGGRLSDESLIARRLVGFRGVVAASPAYLERRGRPERPEDLADHDCIVNTGLSTMPGWQFDTGRGLEPAPVKGRYRADSGEAVVRAAELGLGISYEPTFITQAGLVEGRLEALMPDVQTYTGAFYALYPHRAHLPAKVRLFIDHLVDCWAEPPWEGADAPDGPDARG